jgi:biotin carboxyl carrier protein
VKYYVTVGGRTREVDLVERLGELVVTVDGVAMDVTYEEADRLGQVVLLAYGRSYAVSIEGDENRVGVTLAGYHYAMEIEDERERAAHVAERAAGKSGGVVVATMPGVVVEIMVAPGDELEPGAPLLILEAMKMQNEIDASSGGVVKTVHVTPGQAVSAGERLVTLG